MPENLPIYLPAQFGVDFKIANNSIRQIFSPATLKKLPVRAARYGNQDSFIATRPDDSEVLVVKNTVSNGSFSGDILKLKTSSLDAARLSGDVERQWLQISALPSALAATPAEATLRVQEVIDSWRGQFFYRQENPITQEEGLRPPQMGALFTTLAHWTVSPEEPATIAMPTGTGKTEAMLALLVNKGLSSVLVVVPNSALREQIANKFLTLGILKRAKVAC